MKQKAIIIDIDGTLANSQRVAAFTSPDGKINWEAWISSTRYSPVNEWCKEICVAMQRQGYKLIFMTARGKDFDGESITREWLNNHLNHAGIFEYELIMRPAGDRRPDTDIKLELYTRLIFPLYDVLFTIDDKQSIVDLWRNLNIPSLHCADY